MKNLRKNFFTFLLSIFLITFSSPVLAYDLIVPDTGQDLCYDWWRVMCDDWHLEGQNQICDSPPYCPSEGEDFFGQDGNYTINPPDLTDNGNNTVADNLTGLTWEQKTEVGETYIYTYSDAIDYCNNLTLGGYSDWRVPTRKEFSTILNHGRASPSLDTAYFPYYTGASEEEVYYWTSSEYYDDTTQVWRILMAFGMMDAVSKTALAHKVRCVRGNTLPSSNYTDNGNGTITDLVTGLVWEQKTDDGGSRDKDNTYNWRDALAYCENLLLAGYADWRLPTPKELERVVDLEISSPAIDTNYFPNTNNGLYWSGTTCFGCHKKMHKALAMDFTDGTLDEENKIEGTVYPEIYARCVRHPDPDNDGITYPDDNCPYIFNPGQEDVGDGDGVGDACDNCLAVSNANQEDADRDGTGDVCDNCPDTPNGPDFGTCVKTVSGVIMGTGVSCTDDGYCGVGETCQQNQENFNGNASGDVCECYADLDCDNKVGLSDLVIIKIEFGSNDCEVNPCQADIDGNNKVDLSDLVIMKSLFGRADCPACP